MLPWLHPCHGARSEAFPWSMFSEKSAACRRLRHWDKAGHLNILKNTISRGTPPPKKNLEQFELLEMGISADVHTTIFERLVSSFSIARSLLRHGVTPLSQLQALTTLRPWICIKFGEKDKPPHLFTTLWFLADSGVLNRSTFSRKLHHPNHDPKITPPISQGFLTLKPISHVTLDHFGRLENTKLAKLAKKKFSLPGFSGRDSCCY